MWCEVPDYIHIGLKEAKVDADTVDIIQFSQFVALHDFFNATYRVAEQVGVVDHQYLATPLSRTDHFSGFLNAGRQGFFDEHMESSFQTLSCERKVSADGSGNRNGFDSQVNQFVQCS